MRWNLQYTEFHTAMSCTMYRALQLTVEDFIQHTMLHSVFTVWIPHWTTLHLTEQISGKIVCECCTVCWTELHCVLHCTPRNCTLCCTFSCSSVEETVLQHTFAKEEEERAHYWWKSARQVFVAGDNVSSQLPARTAHACLSQQVTTNHSDNVSSQLCRKKVQYF